MGAETAPEHALSEREKQIEPLLPILLPPITWLVALTVVFALSHLACGDRKWILAGIALLAVFASVASGHHGYRLWRKSGRELPDPRGGTIARVRFMVLLGILVSAMSALVSMALALAAAVVDPCSF